MRVGVTPEATRIPAKSARAAHCAGVAQAHDGTLHPIYGLRFMIPDTGRHFRFCWPPRPLWLLRAGRTGFQLHDERVLADAALGILADGFFPVRGEHVEPAILRNVAARAVPEVVTLACGARRTAVVGDAAMMREPPDLAAAVGGHGDHLVAPDALGILRIRRMIGAQQDRNLRVRPRIVP